MFQLFQKNDFMSSPSLSLSFFQNEKIVLMRKRSTWQFSSKTIGIKTMYLRLLKCSFVVLIVSIPSYQVSSNVRCWFTILFEASVGQ